MSSTFVSPLDKRGCENNISRMILKQSKVFQCEQIRWSTFFLSYLTAFTSHRLSDSKIEMVSTRFCLTAVRSGVSCDSFWAFTSHWASRRSLTAFALFIQAAECSGFFWCLSKALISHLGSARRSCTACALLLLADVCKAVFRSWSLAFTSHRGSDKRSFTASALLFLAALCNGVLYWSSFFAFTSQLGLLRIILTISS